MLELLLRQDANADSKASVGLLALLSDILDALVLRALLVLLALPVDLRALLLLTHSSSPLTFWENALAEGAKKIRSQPRGFRVRAAPAN